MQYRIKTRAGVYAGDTYRINRFGDMQPAGFAPVKTRVFARVYDAQDALKLLADMRTLSLFVQESADTFTIEEVSEEEHT